MDEYIERFKDARVLIVGDVMLDRYWWGDVTRISPEAPVPVVRLRGNTLAAGGAANVAANVAGLGASPLLIGAVGTDADADELEKALAASGIDAKYLIRMPSKPTIVKTRIVAHSQQVVRVDKEEVLELSPDEEDSICAGLDDVIRTVSAIVVSDYGKGFLTGRVLSAVISRAREVGTPVIVDPKGRHFRKYSGAWLITPNRREAAEATGISEESRDMELEAGPRLIEENEFANVIITQGEHGMTLFRTGDEPFHIPAAPVETYDVTGAGDTVIATLAVAAASGVPLPLAAKLANAAAGEVVQHVGTTSITLEMLRKGIAALEISASKEGTA